MSALSGLEDEGFHKTLLIGAIRVYASRMVGPCTDYQIIFVAFYAYRLQTFGSSLDDLCLYELTALSNWLRDECGK